MVRLEWITPDAERRIVEMARVSTDPTKKKRPDADLVKTLIDGGHWSPFEMANICVEVVTTRDIGRQLLRHWTMRPQEFSQRYQNVDVLGDPVYREARLQHDTNRQMSVETDDLFMQSKWGNMQRRVWHVAKQAYDEAIKMGIAKEVARAVLPEGLTQTRMFFNMPLRTALHFCTTRSMEHGAQKEINLIAQELWAILEREVPVICQAYQARAGSYR